MDRPAPLLARCRPRRKSTGFTAIELMVVIAILAILATLAAPSFKPLIQKWRVREAMEDMTATLYVARSEAIRRGGNVIISKLPNNTNGCTWASGTNDWGCGWIVCEDRNSNRKCGDSGDVLLQRIDAPTQVEITRASGGERIILDRWGGVDGAWVGFSFVPLGESISNPASKALCMSSAGRIRVESDPPCISG